MMNYWLVKQVFNLMNYWSYLPNSGFNRRNVSCFKEKYKETLNVSKFWRENER